MHFTITSSQNRHAMVTVPKGGRSYSETTKILVGTDAERIVVLVEFHLKTVPVIVRSNWLVTS